MVEPLLSHDGVSVRDGSNGEDPCEEEEDAIALVVTVLIVGNDPTGIQSEQRHSDESLVGFRRGE